MLPRKDSSSPFSIALKSALICSKAENPAYYQTLIARKAIANQNDKEFVSYPTFSVLQNVPETPINIPVINSKCPESCLYDLDNLIFYLEMSRYIQSIQEEYYCPGCEQKIKASDYLIDYGYEYILRSYRCQLDIKAISEQASKPSSFPQQQESSLLPAVIPKGIMRINYQGDYIFVRDDSTANQPIDKISQLIDKLQISKIIKYANSRNISEESKYDGISGNLRLKRDYLLDFTRKFEAATKPKMSKLKRPFCFARLSTHPYRQIEMNLVSNKIYLWFPSLREGGKDLSLVVDLIKDTDTYSNLDFCGLAYFIKIPEIGIWLTGGMSYAMNAPRGATNECYEIAIRNITSQGRVKCQKKPSLPLGMIGHAGICVGDYVYVAGGSDGKNALTTAYKINWRNPEKEGWVKLANMNYDKFYHSMSCTADQKRIISVGGYYNYGTQFKSNNEIEQYDIYSDKWTVLKLRAEGESIFPTAYPFVHAVSNNEFFIWGGVDGSLGTSIMIHYRLNIETREATRKSQYIKTLQKAISDYIDLNAIWDEEGSRFLFLGPYRSERSKFSIMHHRLNYETLVNKTERKLLYDLNKKQEATEENNSSMLESVMSKPRAVTSVTSYMYK